MSSTPRTYTTRDYTITIYGAFARDFDDWLAVADLLKLLDVAGVDLPVARSAIARLKKAGLLVSEKRGGRAGYQASDQLLAVLLDGDRRLFDAPGATDDIDNWAIILFSIPESQREKRHIMRSRLSSLGFGPASPGAWLAPAKAAPDARRMLERYGLTKYASMFEGRYAGFDSLEELVHRTWDMGPLGEEYQDFFSHHQGTLGRWQTKAPSGRIAEENWPEAFVDYIRLLQDWRQIVFRDPGMPDAVTPFAEIRSDAFFLFSRLRSRLEGPARVYLASVLDSAGG